MTTILFQDTFKKAYFGIGLELHTMLGIIILKKSGNENFELPKNWVKNGFFFFRLNLKCAAKNTLYTSIVKYSENDAPPPRKWDPILEHMSHLTTVGIIWWVSSRK